MRGSEDGLFLVIIFLVIVMVFLMILMVVT